MLPVHLTGQIYSPVESVGMIHNSTVNSVAYLEGHSAMTPFHPEKKSAM